MVPYLNFWSNTKKKKKKTVLKVPCFNIEKPCFEEKINFASVQFHIKPIDSMTDTMLKLLHGVVLFSEYQTKIECKQTNTDKYSYSFIVRKNNWEFYISKIRKNLRYQWREKRHWRKGGGGGGGGRQWN